MNKLFKGTLISNLPQVQGPVSSLIVPASQGNSTGRFVMQQLIDHIVTILGGSQQSGTVYALTGSAIDVQAASYFTKEINAPTTFTFVNPPPNNRKFSFTLEIMKTTADAISWPDTVRWPGNQQPTFNVGRVSLINFVTRDAGNHWLAASRLNYSWDGSGPGPGEESWDNGASWDNDAFWV